MESPSTSQQFSRQLQRDKQICYTTAMTRTPERLTHDFYTHYDTVDLARALLGKKLVTLSRGVRTSGVIVEVEG